MIIVLLLACAPGAEEAQTTIGLQLAAPAGLRAGELPEMEPLELAVRMSLDLRGVRPSLAELEAVELDSGALDALMDEWLYDERLGSRLRDLYTQRFLSQRDRWETSYGLDDAEERIFIRSVGEEMPRILSQIAEKDLPYTELVVGDWTMADETLGAVWPLDYPEDGEGWQEARYTDGRPAVGILATNSFYWRFGSTDSNANRGRANAASRIFLCNDYLDRTIPFDADIDLTSRQAVEGAVSSNAACYACHNTLDPLAAHFWGFFYDSVRSERETTYYHPERERRWIYYTNVGPGYYGQKSDSLTDLGQHLAGDPRFVSCGVETAFELLLQREVTLDDTATLTGLRESFLDGELTMRPLLAALLRGPEYRSGPTESARATPYKIPSPALLASQVEDLTGFSWTYDCGGLETEDQAWCSMMHNDRDGLRMLGGGLDGYTVLEVPTVPIPTLTLVQERLAENAAFYVVAHDLEHPDDARLFTEITFTELPETGGDAMIAQIQLLHRRVFGRRVLPDGPEVAAELALWEDLYAAEGDISRAWAGLLTALLRDPRFLFY